MEIGDKGYLIEVGMRGFEKINGKPPLRTHRYNRVLT